MRRPIAAGSVSAISCTRGCRYSSIASTWSAPARTSLRTRAKRVARVFSAATRIVSSYDIQSARWRAVSASSWPDASTGPFATRAMRSR